MVEEKKSKDRVRKLVDKVQLEPILWRPVLAAFHNLACQGRWYTIAGTSTDSP